MPRYRFNYRFADYGSVVLEAPSVDEARDMLDEIDGGLLPTDPESGAYDVLDFEETEEEPTWPDGAPTYEALRAKGGSA